MEQNETEKNININKHKLHADAYECSAELPRKMLSAFKLST